MVSLLKYLIRRVVEAIPLLFGLATFVFFLSRLLPGDPTMVFISPTVPPSVVGELKSQFGLDRPLFEQYTAWLMALPHGELGYSFTHGTPVVDVLWSVFPNTILLGTTALVLEIIIAIAITMIAVSAPGSKRDRVLSNGMLVVYTLPSFWIGIILLSGLSYGLGLFPSSHMYSVGMPDNGDVAVLQDLLWHLALPALAIAIPGAAGLARYLRSNITTTLQQEYVLAARGMGVPEGRIFRQYVLPNSISPMISMVGIEIGILLTGVLVTETLFAWPGMGRIAVMAIFARDYPLILGCTIVAGIVVVFGSLLADVVNAIIDPRIRTS